MKRLLLAALLSLSTLAAAQSADVLGTHDLSSGASPVRGAQANACTYCHVPHSGLGKGPLWGQMLSSQVYTLYNNDVSGNVGVQPLLGASSSLCLSCHDGTVAPGQLSPSGQVQTVGTMTSVLGSQLQTSHPFSLKLPIKDASNLVPNLTANGTTADPTGAVKLIKGNIECTSCHDPHNMRKDTQEMKFLVRDGAKGALCLSCHTTQPRIVNGRSNPLDAWTNSTHATSVAQVTASSGLGGYSTIADFACQSCHVSHVAAGPSLLRAANPPVPNVDNTSQNCLNCHGANSKLVQPVANVMAEFLKPGHPFPAGTNLHSVSEAVAPDNNRHAACADCHNGHASQAVVTFTAPPDVRPSQLSVRGVAMDGSPLPTPATMQYQNCLRCHGTNIGKQVLPIFGYLPSRAGFAGDPLNLIPQFNLSAVSAHPVMRDATLASQPSLLKGMLDLAGVTQSRLMSTRIFCTDCHNSDDNREFGGNGPNGPHGSKNTHILERRYEMSQVAAGTFPNGGPGSTITNLMLNPPLDPASGGPYSLCAKCHDLNNVVSNASFAQHSTHILGGFSCSVCHTAHGVPAGSPGLTGARLVNFDANVVGPNAGVIAYNGATCTLTCHNMTHNSNGTVTPAVP